MLPLPQRPLRSRRPESVQGPIRLSLSETHPLSYYCPALFRLAAPMLPRESLVEWLACRRADNGSWRGCDGKVHFLGGSAMGSLFNEFGSVAKLSLVLIACCVMLCMPGCGSNSSTLPGEPTLDSIVVTPAGESIPVGKTQQFAATGHYSDGTTKDLTTTATWNSTVPTVATVSNTAGTNGLATGVGKGSTSITATLGTPVGQTGFDVTEPIIAISLSAASNSVASGLPDQFTATATYADNSTGDVTSLVVWNSDTPSVATVSNVPAFNGLASTFTTGQANISATSGGVSSTPFALMVTAAVPVGLFVSPQNPVINDGGATQKFTALAQYSDGTTQDESTSATWTSNTPAVASVGPTGLATSLALASGTAGYTSISASWAVPAPAVAARKTKKSASKSGVPAPQSSLGTTVTGVSILSVTLHTGNGYAGTLTQHNDVARTGQNINESTLNTGNVTSAGFGKLFTQPVDGYVFAQPLYVPNVSIAGGTHNVIYLATENDSVYAFDADSGAAPNNAPLWKVTLLDAAHGSGPNAVPVNATGATGGQIDVACGNINSEIGITSTPVIDPSTNTMYVAAESKEGSTGNFVYFQRLHAIDIRTGAEKAQGPVVIGGSVPGTSDGSSTVTFVPLMHLSRPGLLLQNGTVFIAYSSNCDNTPYHGWVFSYNASTFAQTGIYATTANGNSSTGGLGGIWMSGCGIAADVYGNVFLISGNGDFDTVNVPAVNTGDSMLKFSQRGNVLTVVDYFTPSDQDALDSSDLDLGSAGLTLLTAAQAGGANPLIVQAGKKGNVYLVNSNQMTANNQHYCSTCTTDTNVVQEIPNGVTGMWSMPAYWNYNVYFWGIGDNLVAYSISGGMLSAQPTSMSKFTLAYPGSVPTISASNSTSNGILWAIDATNSTGAQAVLHAFDATDVATELYNSTQATGNRDQAGPGVKFTVPTVGNGKVYIGTQTELVVYGLLP